jgi:hypothetical protein
MWKGTGETARLVAALFVSILPHQQNLVVADMELNKET